MQLKSEAYDCIAQIEQWKQKLALVNQQILEVSGQIRD